MTRGLRRGVLLTMVALGACGRLPGAVDAGELDSGADPLDAGLDDAGPADAGLDDAGPPDAGSTDAGVPDAGADAGRAQLHLLFIGNSYIFVNDLPGMLSRIAATAGSPPTLDVEEVTGGGLSLGNHWYIGTAQARIAERTWTHVVLQGQSLEPLTTPIFAEYAQRFGDVAVDAGARPTFYVTWARAAGDPVYAESWSGGSPAAMQDRLTQAYQDVARPWPSSLVVRAGEAFRTSLAERPDIVLHQSDGSHPTIAGTYLVACTFYVALTGRDVPATSEVPPGLTAEVAESLRGVARRIGR